MQIIPVIDLKGGQVVHARRGARDLYAPLSTPLVASSAPDEVVAALLGLAPFRALYVADLDAITGSGGNGPVIAALRRAHAGLALWVDAGEATPEALAARAAGDAGTPVLGSESLPDDGAAAAALGCGAEFVLSLDHDAAGRLGPAFVHEQADLWPDRVIVMTLAKVGSGEGPDLDRLRAVQAKNPLARLFAAGGVRGPEDLDALEAMGVAGVLVASALHDGRLASSDLAGRC